MENLFGYRGLVILALWHIPSDAEFPPPAKPLRVEEEQWQRTPIKKSKSELLSVKPSLFAYLAAKPFKNLSFYSTKRFLPPLTLPISTFFSRYTLSLSFSPKFPFFSFPCGEQRKMLQYLHYHFHFLILHFKSLLIYFGYDVYMFRYDNVLVSG